MPALSRPARPFGAVPAVLEDAALVALTARQPAQLLVSPPV